MTRNSRQSKILELISLQEICTQEDLVESLRESGFDTTQATISRDIKELGLIKKISSTSGKFKYVFPENNLEASNKYIFVLKESVVSVKLLKNFVVINVLNGLANAVSYIIDNLNIENLIGSTFGNNTILLIFNTNEDSMFAFKKLENIINC